ncbi:hypothetical protein PhiBtE2641_02 [Burkholderia phage PhiBt-E264.1]|nr:hypothetical protein PhiBtE2641_02 [Burkholderia phage PhiBt-E264.1]
MATNAKSPQGFRLAGFVWAHLAPDIVNIAKRGAVYNPFF